MKAAPYRSVLFVVLILMLGTSPALATHPYTNAETENLKQRIETFETGMVGEPGEEMPSSLLVAGNHLTFSGLLEVEANYSNADNADASSDLTLSAFEFSTEVAINDQIGGHVILLYEEDPDVESLKVDEAVISLRNPKPFLGQIAGFHVGKMYLPFGRFNSSMVTGPLTLALGETKDTAALLTLEGELWSFSLGVFNGDSDASGDKDHIDSLVTAFEIVPTENLIFGLSYISDLAESDNGLVADSSFYPESVAAASAFISAAFGQVGFEAEIVGALDGFDTTLIGGTDLTGTKPLVWNLEINWAPVDKFQLIARYEQARDFQDDVTRYGMASSYGLFHNTVVALEYLYAASDTDPDAETITAQLAFDF